jgi:putative AlgH/UPF0301 family transcriptional regulator
MIKYVYGVLNIINHRNVINSINSERETNIGFILNKLKDKETINTITKTNESCKTYYTLIQKIVLLF